MRRRLRRKRPSSLQQCGRKQQTPELELGTQCACFLNNGCFYNGLYVRLLETQLEEARQAAAVAVGAEGAARAACTQWQREAQQLQVCVTEKLPVGSRYKLGVDANCMRQGMLAKLQQQHQKVVQAAGVGLVAPLAMDAIQVQFFHFFLFARGLLCTLCAHL